MPAKKAVAERTRTPPVRTTPPRTPPARKPAARNPGFSRARYAEMEGHLTAVARIRAYAEYDLHGTVLTANERFLSLFGYTLDEVVGRHDSLFLGGAAEDTTKHQAAWVELNRGEIASAGQYRRRTKSGHDIWLQGYYAPVRGLGNKLVKVVQYATDVTEGVHGALAMTQAVTQTQQVVAKAKSGDLSERVPLEGKSGPILELCGGINELLDTTADGLREVVRVLGALAQGDLTQTVDKAFAGIFGQLKNDANGTVAQLARTIRNVAEATDAINIAANEIANGNTDLSQRTEEQASSLEETASSMEELTATVKQNADNARQANQLAATASEVALKGGSVVSQVVATMGSITDSSKKIVDIISVIDGIAFQTNILALNAAVEAARAGEQGRGFAVVASEVRNLAQRSAAAAKEIKTLIGNSVEKVEAGSRLVESAGKTMEDIVGAVRRVTDIMSEITAASLEQSAGIEQVNQAIAQMDQVTQQNAALVEEAAAAAESMKSQAASLSESVGQFSLVDGDAAQASEWDGAERRGPNRAINVARIGMPRPAAKAPPRHAAAARPATAGARAARSRSTGGNGGTGTDDWESF